jgi:hypothetical protein
MYRKRTPEQIQAYADFFLTAESDKQVADHFGIQRVYAGVIRRLYDFPCPILRKNIENRSRKKGPYVFTDEVMEAVKEVYQQATSHQHAVLLLKERGISVTRLTLQTITCRKKVPRPLLRHGGKRR